MEEEWKKLTNYYRLPMITTVHYDLFHELMESEIINITAATILGHMMYKLHARTPSGETFSITGQSLLGTIIFYKNGEKVGNLTKFIGKIMYKTQETTPQEKAIFEPFMEDLMNFMVAHYNEEKEQIS